MQTLGIDLGTTQYSKAANWPLTSGNASWTGWMKVLLGLSHDLESVRPRSGDFLAGAYYPQVHLQVHLATST